MGRITSGISQIGGKYRLVNELLSYTPYHEFFLSIFLGAAHFELNKPRCRYECWNDAESEIINYLLQIREHPKEFDEMKQGVFGLVSQEICNRIVNGKINPKNNLEKAYFFYYLNKLTFGGSVQKGYRGITLPTSCKDNKIETFKTKGYCGLNQNRAIPQSTFHEKDIDEIKANFRGTTPKAPFKGINPKTTRPFKNNDCGLLSPVKPKSIKRLRYVNLTTYDFRKVYKMFYEAFHVRKGLKRECFIYADPPFPGTEKYYGDLFPKELHQDLLKILLETPFNFMLSIGGNCLELYIDPLKDAGWIMTPVKVKYSTDANSQKDSQEFICTNYNIEKVALMTQDSNQNIIEKYL